MAEQRKRLNAKQNSKGEYYFDVTVEESGEEGVAVSNEIMAKELVSAIQETEKQFSEAGYKIIKAT